MTALEVREGMYTLTFEGTLIGSSDSERKPPKAVRTAWDTVNPKDAKGYLQWVEMALYAVEPGQDERIPEGGYYYSVIHNSVRYHRDGSYCPDNMKGFPSRAADTDFDLLPCPACKPPMLWDPAAGEHELPRLLCDPDLTVRCEAPRYELYADPSPHGVTRKIIGNWLTVPAQYMLEEARRKDPKIDAALSRPAPPKAAV